jgi:hypothetical protein
MKTKIVGILAIIIAFAASAFTAPSHTKHQSSYVWFKISSSISPGAAVPKAMASYLNSGTAPSGGANGCSGSTYQCVSGFRITPKLRPNSHINTIK